MGAPGWYPDPNTGEQRYFDGTKWGPVAPPPIQQPRKGAPVWPWLLGIGGGMFLLLAGCVAVVAVVGSSSKSTRSSSSTSPPAALAPHSSAPSPPAETAPAAPAQAPLITYTVTSDAPLLNISYFNELNDMTQRNDVAVPVNIEFASKSTYPMVSMSAQTSGTQVQCSISANGQVRDSKTSTGRDAVVVCTASV